MPIRQPITSRIDPHNPWTTILHFGGDSALKFYMRGSISWPEGKQEGFAMMAGMSLDTKTIFVFDQFRFWTISHWLNEDGSIRLRERVKDTDQVDYYFGLIHFIQQCDAKYNCCAFFHGGQHNDVVRRHSQELYRNEHLPRRIQLIDVPYVKELGDNLINEKAFVEGFMADSGSYLDKSLSQWERMQTTGADGDGAVHALRALLAGFEHQPHVRLETMQ